MSVTDDVAEPSVPDPKQPPGTVPAESVPAENMPVPDGVAATGEPVPAPVAPAGAGGRSGDDDAEATSREDAEATTGDDAAEEDGSHTPLQRLKRSAKPGLRRSQLMVGLLCALLGFALVVQVRQSGQAELSTLRQDDLVRLLDEVTGRAEQLDAEVQRLQSSRDELASGTGQAQAALELAQQRATSEGILSGRLPAEGPGVVITVRDPDRSLEAKQMFNLLEELRNAGAEVAQVNDVRLVASSSFVDGPGGIVADGKTLAPPFRWVVIGDPATLDRALEIPGGALPTIRAAGGTATTQQEHLVTVDQVIDLTDPRFARPAENG